MKPSSGPDPPLGVRESDPPSLTQINTPSNRPGSGPPTPFNLLFSFTLIDRPYRSPSFQGGVRDKYPKHRTSTLWTVLVSSPVQWGPIWQGVAF